MFNGIGTTEMFLFGILALLLFGSNLPEVARKLGGTYRGLKRSVDEFKREFQAVESYDPKSTRPTYTDEPIETESTAPRFKPPQEPPQEN
ncbi:MAG: twin-arginine translocase TatA/TatE family subunit [Pirellula sp.]